MTSRVAVLMALAACTGQIDSWEAPVDERDVPSVTTTTGAPLAVDDEYPIEASIAAETGVLQNDVLHDAVIVGYGATGTEQANIGQPAATVAGGSLTLLADGRFQYSAPASMPATGIDTFVYTVKNRAGTSSAAVTITLSCGTSTCDGCCNAEGTCETGTTDHACGNGGYACAACTDVGNSCAESVCVNTSVASDGFVDDSRLHLEDGDDVSRMRRDLARYFWGSGGYPLDLLPRTVQIGVPSPLAPLLGVARIDRLVIDQDDHFSATALVIRPVTPNERLVIWHQGHSSDLSEAGGHQLMERLLARGYTVIALWMPLYGENHGPPSSHDLIVRMTPHSGHAIRYFLEPSVAAINWATATNEFSSIAMVGLSGGGWTTTVMAALDPRIKLSVPAAGSLPLYLRTAVEDRGDAEQTETSLYRIAGYLDLYALGALGEQRAQLHVYNFVDSCCFSGWKVSQYATNLWGALGAVSVPSNWSVYLDSSVYGHLITSVAIDQAIVPFLEGH